MWVDSVNLHWPSGPPTRHSAETVSVSSELGELREIALPQGRLRYREHGSGEPLVLLHGVFCNGDLWRKVVPQLAPAYRCVTPDLPLGSHELPLPRNTDLTPPGIADLIADFIAALELRDVTLIGNNTGGAFAQLVAVQHPQLLARLILASCDALEHFPPQLLRPLTLMGRWPNAMFVMAQLLRPRWVQRLMYSWSTKADLPDEVYASYSRNGVSSRRIVRDFARVLRAIEPSHTLEAAKRLRTFQKPTLIVWAADDRFFPPQDGRKLAAIIPHSRFELVEDSYTFLSEDQPERLAKLIDDFIVQTEHRPSARVA
jgi:pimeloyl-ACP methyl ester carboxylesterase